MGRGGEGGAWEMIVIIINFRDDENVLKLTVVMVHDFEYTKMDELYTLNEQIVQFVSYLYLNLGV